MSRSNHFVILAFDFNQTKNDLSGMMTSRIRNFLLIDFNSESVVVNLENTNVLNMNGDVFLVARPTGGYPPHILLSGTQSEPRGSEVQLLKYIAQKINFTIRYVTSLTTQDIHVQCRINKQLRIFKYWLFLPLYYYVPL